MSKLYLTIIFFTISIFFGCSKFALENRLEIASELAKNNKFASQDINTDKFTLRTYIKTSNALKPLKIYIEGDGFAWIDRRTLSSNPTPINPLAFKLATIDSYENIAYIARPCQYVTTNNCKETYWSNKRFSSEVVESVNEVINKLKSNTEQKIELVGFSGGGAIAVLVASLRSDVIHITTVAGNLNHKLLNKQHKVSQMPKSLNAVDVAWKISHIPQLHLVGENDTIVFPSIADSYKKASLNSEKILIKTIPNCTHTQGWEDYWRSSSF